MLQSQKGFTLIELLIAIAILGILSSITMINVTYAIAKNDLATAAALLAADIRTMQQLSLEKPSAGSNNTINITFSANSYQIITDNTSRAGLTPKNLPTSITITPANGSVLMFDPANLSNNTATMITLTSSSLPFGENKRTIIISKVTGRIRIDNSNTPAYRSTEN